MAQLIEIIKTANFNSDSGPVVTRVKLWDERTTTASHYKGDSKSDIDVNEDTITDNESIRPFAENLVNKEKSFIVTTGTPNDTCTLIWEIAA